MRWFLISFNILCSARELDAVTPPPTNISRLPQSVRIQLPPFAELKNDVNTISQEAFKAWWTVQGDNLFREVDVDHDQIIQYVEYYKLGKTTADDVIGITANSRFWSAFVNAVAMILATEIGDKTFFIAAVLAMRHAQGVVFLGAIGALIVMTVLSVAIGFSLPALLPREYTHWCATFLFFYFGLKLLKEARDLYMAGGGFGPSDELSEVEQELATKGLVSGKDNDDTANDDVEMGCDTQRRGSKSKITISTPLVICTQTFLLTFLAEWGDRSQIATIAMAADKDPLGVTVGGILGHSVCTGVACIGGRYLAAKIHERTVLVFGGILFLLFGLHSLIVGADS